MYTNYKNQIHDDLGLCSDCMMMLKLILKEFKPEAAHKAGITDTLTTTNSRLDMYSHCSIIWIYYKTSVKDHINIHGYCTQSFVIISYLGMLVGKSFMNISQQMILPSLYWLR